MPKHTNGEALGKEELDALVSSKIATGKSLCFHRRIPFNPVAALFGFCLHCPFSATAVFQQAEHAVPHFSSRGTGHTTLGLI